jgi:hypothetical protein
VRQGTEGNGLVGGSGMRGRHVGRLIGRSGLETEGMGSMT